ncbi:MAG: alcohol dehydrogenase catalytic domain-containing protein [Bacillota bacterium]
MQALRLYGPSDLRLQDIPVPKASAGGLVVRVEACAICGSDVRNVRAGGSSHGMDLPVTIGHEIAGTIHAIGEGAVGFEPGQRVVLAAVIACGSCRYCLRGMQNQCRRKEAISYRYDGGFAEYIAIPPQLVAGGGVLPMPEGLSFAEACIAEPFACALNGQELSRVGLGDAVCVMGAGPVGLMHCLLARARGAGRVILTDVDAGRLELSRDFPEIDCRIDGSRGDVVERVLTETGEEGADAVIVAAPSGEAQAQATRMAARGGRINLFGGLPKGNSETTFDSNVIHYKELFVHGTSDSRIPHMMTILSLMASGQIQPGKLITKALPLSRFQEGFDLAASGKALKVILEPGK